MGGGGLTNRPKNKKKLGGLGGNIRLRFFYVLHRETPRGIFLRQISKTRLLPQANRDQSWKLKKLLFEICENRQGSWCIIYMKVK